MLIRISQKELNKLLKAQQGGKDGVSAKDLISIEIGNTVSDGIKEKARWNIHRFDSALYDRLTGKRQRVAEVLAVGNAALKNGDPHKAGDLFSRGFGLQEELVNKEAFSSSIVEGNALLDEGINAMTTLICGGAETAFNNANAQLGAGDGVPVTLVGTLTFTLNSKAVTGAGTAFDTALVVGDWVRATTSTTYYRVAAIVSATSLTLERLFETATETAVTGYKLDVSLIDLPGANVTWQGMDTGYPTFGSGQNMVFQSVFGSAAGNHAWKVFGARNGVGANKNMNIKFSDEGTKTAGQTWTLNLTIDLM